MANIPLEKIAEKAAKVCESYGAFLYDILYVKEGKTQVLRILADREGGIEIDVCEKISREISAYLDETNPINDVYTLEVSSPGVERKLRTDKHYEMVMGKMITVSLYSPVDGKKSFTGKLLGITKNEVTILDNNSELTFERTKIADASLYFDINEFLRNK